LRRVFAQMKHNAADFQHAATLAVTVAQSNTLVKTDAMVDAAKVAQLASAGTRELLVSAKGLLGERAGRITFNAINKPCCLAFGQAFLVQCTSSACCHCTCIFIVCVDGRKFKVSVTCTCCWSILPTTGIYSDVLPPWCGIAAAIVTAVACCSYCGGGVRLSSGSCCCSYCGGATPDVAILFALIVRGRVAAGSAAAEQIRLPLWALAVAQPHCLGLLAETVCRARCVVHVLAVVFVGWLTRRDSEQTHHNEGANGAEGRGD